MRSIKFKAWDNKNECWLFDGAAMDLQYSGETGAIMFDNDAHTRMNDSLTWVQFTGLTDKNGKEIYSGDILKKCYGSNTPSGVVEYHEERAAFIFQDGFNPLLFEVMTSAVEVIGNIYELPELLEC